MELKVKVSKTICDVLTRTIKDRSDLLDLQMSIFGFSQTLLLFNLYHREFDKSESHTPLIHINRLTTLRVDDRHNLIVKNRTFRKSFIFFNLEFDDLMKLFDDN